MSLKGSHQVSLAQAVNTCHRWEDQMKQRYEAMGKSPKQLLVKYKHSKDRHVKDAKLKKTWKNQAQLFLPAKKLDPAPTNY